MDYVTLSDAARWYATVASAFLGFLIVRLTVNRLRRDGWRASVRKQPSPLVSAGLCLMLFTLILRRLDDLGVPGDRFLWLSTTAVTLIGVGLLMTTVFTSTPPWRRGSDTSPPEGVN